MSSNGTTGSWHQDPSLPPGTLRWWDGQRWTEHTKPDPTVHGATAPPPHPGPPAAAPPGYGAPGYGSPALQGGHLPYAPGQPPVPAQYLAPGTGTRRQVSAGKRNEATLICLAVSAVYVVVALTTPLAIIGIFPAFLAFRAMSRREPLWPLALIAAIGDVSLFFLKFSGH